MGTTVCIVWLPAHPIAVLAHDVLYTKNTRQLYDQAADEQPYDIVQVLFLVSPAEHEIKITGVQTLCLNLINYVLPLMFFVLPSFFE